MSLSEGSLTAVFRFFRRAVSTLMSKASKRRPGGEKPPKEASAPSSSQAKETKTEDGSRTQSYVARFLRILGTIVVLQAFLNREKYVRGFIQVQEYFGLTSMSSPNV